MKAWGYLICVACAATALGVVPADAGAYESEARGPAASFEVKGSHGYEIQATISEGGSDLSVTEDGFLGSGADYSIFGGVATHETFSADFGRLGKIAVHFEPSGKVRRREQPHCEGGPEITRFGSFLGTVRFRGEQGYTQFRSKRVAGKVSSAPRQVCHFPKHDGSHERSRREGSNRKHLVTTFSASSGGVSFQASRPEDIPAEEELTSYAAFSGETLEGVSIFRHVLAFGRPTSFSFDPGLDSATVTPPAPFSGSASFQRIDSYASRWEGPLTVSFPGRPDVPLTGRDFSWSLSSARESSGSLSVSFGGAF